MNMANNAMAAARRCLQMRGMAEAIRMAFTAFQPGQETVSHHSPVKDTWRMRFFAALVEWPTASVWPDIQQMVILLFVLQAM